MDLNSILNFIKETLQNVVKGFRFGSKAQLAFLEDLYTLINDGIPANRAIEMMGQVGEGMNKQVAASIAESIGQGKPLAEGMKVWFAPNVVEIIRVGEAGGALAQTIKSAINMLSQQGVAIGAFIGALSYPLFVLTIGCVVIVYLDSSVMTQFKQIKPIEKWPSDGQQLVATAAFIRHWWWLVLSAIFAFMIGFKMFLNQYTNEFRAVLDQYPPFSLYRQLVAARFLETLGLLVSNGVVFKSAIKVMQLQANPYMLWHLHKIEYFLSMGKLNIADVLNTGLINQNDLMRLRIMAEVKGFEHGLVRMGINGTIKATATLKTIAKILGGVMLVSGGGLIIMIIKGIYMTGMSMAG